MTLTFEEFGFRAIAERIGCELHAESTYCEFGPNSRPEACDGSCKTIADRVVQILRYELRSGEVSA